MFSAGLRVSVIFLSIFSVFLSDFPSLSPRYSEDEPLSVSCLLENLEIVSLFLLFRRLDSFDMSQKLTIPNSARCEILHWLNCIAFPGKNGNIKPPVWSSVGV